MSWAPRLDSLENYQGATIYCEWEADEEEWLLLRDWFVDQ